MPRNPNAEPKPFVLVDIPKEEPDRRPVATHEKFAGLTGRLELVLKVVSEHLFVGSGAYEFDPNHGNRRPDVWYTFYRRNGQLCVPGTSLKGAIRAIVEAISNSCVSQSRVHERRLIQLDKTHTPSECKAPHSLCPACRLFGVTGFRGRAHFTDAFPEGSVRTIIVKIPELRHHDPKRIRRLDRARRFYEQRRFEPFTDSRPEKGKWFIEAIHMETTFHTALVFENLAPQELGLLMHALGWEPEANGYRTAFTPKLGGAKPRCFGSVEFRPVRLRLWSGGVKGLLAPQEVQGKDMLPRLSQYLQACRDRKLLHVPSWDALKEGFQPKDERCPREVY